METRAAQRGMTQAPDSGLPRNLSEVRPTLSANPSTQVAYGTLVAFGPAPYRFDATKPTNYQVTLRDSTGQERTFWGSGLKDALQESRSRPQLGDQVGLRRTGANPVAVNGEIRRVRRERERALWVIENAEFFRRGQHRHAEGQVMSESRIPSRESGLTQSQEAAAAIRSAQITREELQLKYPDLSKAVFQQFSAQEQFAAAYVKAGLIRESDRQQVIAQMRERLAGKLERGELLQGPDETRITALIRRSVNRVSADIGRPPVEIKPRNLEPPTQAPVLQEVPVRM